MTTYTDKLGANRSPLVIDPELLATLKKQEHSPKVELVINNYDKQPPKYKITFEHLPKDVFDALSTAIYDEFGQHVQGVEAWLSTKHSHQSNEPGFLDRHENIRYDIEIRGRQPVAQLAPLLGLEVPSHGANRQS